MYDLQNSDNMSRYGGRWQQLVGVPKSQVSFAQGSHENRALFKKRPGNFLQKCGRFVPVPRRNRATGFPPHWSIWCFTSRAWYSRKPTRDQGGCVEKQISKSQNSFGSPSIVATPWMMFGSFFDVFVFIYIYIRMYIHIQVYTCTCIHIYIYMYMYTHRYIYIYTHTYVHLYTYTYVYIHKDRILNSYQCHVRELVLFWEFGFAFWKRAL